MLKPSVVRIAAVGFWRRFLDHIGAGGGGRKSRIGDLERLRYFLQSRSSLVAQSALYGYLRTRAGTRFPELFAHDEFSKSIEAAKWNIWLACLSDLSVYAGGLLRRRTRAGEAEVGRLVTGAVEAILEVTGIPPGAGGDFPGLADRLRARLAACDWGAVEDNETPFAESPPALVYWAPVMDELKQFDEEIVRNSVRFRWQEVRRDLRGNLDAEALMTSAGASLAGSRAGEQKA
jgi:hypothetical protein